MKRIILPSVVLAVLAVTAIWYCWSRYGDGRPAHRWLVSGEYVVVRHATANAEDTDLPDVDEGVVAKVVYDDTADKGDSRPVWVEIREGKRQDEVVKVPRDSLEITSKPY